MKNKFIFCLLVFALLSTRITFGQATYTAIASGRWVASATWSQSGTPDSDGNNIPDANDVVIIPSPFIVNLTGGLSYQATSLTILNGGALDMNVPNAVLDIFPNGGFLQVDAGGVISNAVLDDNNQINFMNNGSLIINGTIQTDRLEFEGLNQTVNITGNGTLSVRRFAVNNSGVTINLNTTGSFASTRDDFPINGSNVTINGTGTMDVGSGGDLDLSGSGLIVGCHLNLDDDIDMLINGANLTVMNGGVVTTVDDIRVGPGVSANNASITIQIGGTLTIGDDFNFDFDGTGSADNFTMSNFGTVTVGQFLQFYDASNITITNYHLFTQVDDITSGVGANVGLSFTNAANATFNVGGALDADLSLDFTAFGNTVNYNRAGAQNIATTTYYNLTLSNSGSKTAMGSFALRGNWTRSGAANFNPNFQTVTFSALAGSAAQSITVVASETFFNLIINSAFATSPQLTMNNPVTVINTLDMISGIVNLNGNQFTLGGNGVASDLNRTPSTTTNWMYGGPFRRFWLNGVAVSPVLGNCYGVFPLGASTPSSYRPLWVNSTSSPTSNGSYTATHIANSGVTDLSPFFDDDPTPGVINIVRKHNAQFIGSASGLTGGVYNISITMTGLPAAPGALADMRLAVNTGAALSTTVTNVGSHFGATGTPQNPSVARTGIAVGNISGDFRITTINAVTTPLPIELISFNGEVVKDAVQINWETASELNNDFFTVERSSGGEIFSSIGAVNGKGTTNQGGKYSLTDYTPNFGTTYYRLKQTDFDGTFTYSKIIQVTYEGAVIPVMDVFPNPSKGVELNIKITGLKNMDTVRVVMYDQLGRECLSLLLNVDRTGVAQKTFTPQTPIQQGMYLLKAGTLTKRLVVNPK